MRKPRRKTHRSIEVRNIGEGIQNYIQVAEASCRGYAPFEVADNANLALDNELKVMKRYQKYKDTP